ncbi:MAG: DUF485 domain-containing protein, partial [Janthinobacterium lividum]
MVWRNDDRRRSLTARTRRAPAAGSQRKRDEQAYSDLARDPDFAELKRRYRRFNVPATIAFLVWYVTYVVCNSWARDFMDTPVVGHINVALVFGLPQFLPTLIAFGAARSRPGDDAAARPAGRERQPRPDHRAVPRRGGGDARRHLLGVRAEQERGRPLRRRTLVHRLPE